MTAQIKLLDDLSAFDWDAPRETIWGMKPLSMVVTKTHQHTFEHGDIAQQAQAASNPRRRIR
jgi:hypothetical protein